MSQPDENTISRWLKSIGLHVELESRASGHRQAEVEHLGVPIYVQVRSSDSLLIYVPFGILNPRTAAPLLRRLLNLNATLASGCHFGLAEQRGVLYFGASRLLEGLDQGEFVELMDYVASGYPQFCGDLVRDFELSAQP